MPRNRGSGAKGRSTRRALRVRTVKSTGGPPATTVHVEVKPDKLKDAVGEFAKVEQVVAEIPEQRADAVRWQETKLYKYAEKPDAPGGHTVQYASTHYGPSETAKYGVRVRVKTDTGSVRVREPGDPRSVREADKPETEGRPKRRR